MQVCLASFQILSEPITPVLPAQNHAGKLRHVFVFTSTMVFFTFCYSVFISKIACRFKHIYSSNYLYKPPLCYPLMHSSSLRFSLSLNLSLLLFCGASFFSSAMAGLTALEALTEQLYDFIQSMEDDGIVDYHFKDRYNMKEANGPFLFIELIPTYISDSESTLEEMTTELDQPLVNFKHLEQLCTRLKGGTACIGACRVATSCGELRRAAIAKNKDK
ncbi:hypothetical protein OIU77_013207 [Salix suchowensis]|uniref:Histidine-containing phosphotransfer protein n=1 Tax=Salix suchowensis TaxID=1278906 RepID=A0ABQ8ZTB4_9ROSI|nr:hypothetical protein OIU77_013207 [Salix suchowensis]